MNRYFWPLAVLLAGSAACGKDDPPARIDRVEVVSAMDSILAVGRGSQLTATAYDAGGHVLHPTFSWLSSNTAVADVGAAGLVTANAAGSVTIRAVVPAETGIEGSLRVRVVAADLAMVQTLGNDDYGDALVAALSGTTRPAAQTSWTAIVSHAGDGNIVAIRGAVSDLRSQAAATTDAHDRVLLAVLAVFGNEIERRLAL